MGQREEVDCSLKIEHRPICASEVEQLVQRLEIHI